MPAVMNVTLHRLTDNGRCTQGVLQVDDESFFALERPWAPGSPGGTKGVSCVPAGIYRLVPHDSEAHPRTFALVNDELHVYHLAVPDGEQGRTACLIHAANFPQELRGCIALGMEQGVDAVLKSRLAVERFYELVPWESGHTLEIIGP